ncbi:MAG: DUF4870 domain-containing protein [Candidatus Eremiobacteraeota bacterium]|nr:DUF4870 domain-containing protein [Candidatus Eremiobacteraeota bacterium]
MDCYFHSHVPSVAPCGDCAKPICATCRDSAGFCPACRLAAKMESAQASRQQIGGEVPPRQYAEPNQQQYQQRQYQGPPSAPTVRHTAVESTDSVESRALVALGYPLFPLALLSLFDKKQSPGLRRSAYQAIGFNLAVAGLYFVLSVMGQLPLPTIAGSADVMGAMLIPVYLVASVFYGIKTWQGENVRVPILSDWIEERLPAKS